MIGIVILALLVQGPKKLEIDESKKIQPPLVVPAGTTIPLTLTNRISTKHAKDGDGIYAKTAFPITVNNTIVIPEGSYVRGKIVEVKRPGRVKGKAELTLSFQSMVLPNGITIPLYTSLGSSASGEKKGENTVAGESGKGKDAGDIGKSAAGGGIIGVITGGGKGAAIGGAGGAVVGAVGVLLSRGEDLVLEPGTMIEIVLDHPVEP